MNNPTSAPGAATPINPAQDPDVSQLIQQAVQKAAWRAFSAGLAVAILGITAITLVKAQAAGQFLHGAGWGFGIGLGVVLGGSLLNALIGVIDQAKSDLLGN